MNKIITKHFERITKTQAEKLFNDNVYIAVISHKLNPENMYLRPMIINKRFSHFESFSEMVNMYTWYNCNLNEVGYYPAFYKIIDTEGLII